MKSLSKVALAALVVASPLAFGSANAQTPPPSPVSLGSQPAPSKSDQPAAKEVVDCGLTALHIGAQVHRQTAVIDVAFRVKGIKGGLCKIAPEIQIVTGRFENAGRLLQETFVDGVLLKPLAISDNPNPEKLFTGWRGNLAAGEERKVDFRFYAEGETMRDSGDSGPPSVVAVESRTLGPQIFEKAPITASASFEPGVKATGVLGTGNRTAAAEQQPAAPDGTVRLTAAFSDRDRTPTFAFHYDAPPPPAANATSLSGGLRVIEYLRNGIVRDLANGIADPKAEKAVTAAWDQAFNVAFAASQSKDPIVAGLGLRTIAYLGGGLSPTATSLKAAGGGGNGLPAPDSILKATADVAAAYTAATGQDYAPSPATAHPLRELLMRLGDPAKRKKDADDALKRLGKRVEGGKIALTVGTVFDVVPVPTPANGVDTATSTAISFDHRRRHAGVASAAPLSPVASRFVRAFTHRRPSRGFLVFLLVVLAAGGAGFFAWKSRAEAPKPA